MQRLLLFSLIPPATHRTDLRAKQVVSFIINAVTLLKLIVACKTCRCNKVMTSSQRCCSFIGHKERKNCSGEAARGVTERKGRKDQGET